MESDQRAAIYARARAYDGWVEASVLQHGRGGGRHVPHDVQRQQRPRIYLGPRARRYLVYTRGTILPDHRSIRGHWSYSGVDRSYGSQAIPWC